MNTQREVFNKLFKEEKTELATQKIELGLIDDVKKQEKKVESDFKTALKGVYQSANGYRDASESVKKLVALIGRGITNAKSLGADLIVKQLSNKLAGAEQLQKMANKNFEKIRNIE